MEQTIKASLKTDYDGFISQECPSCLKKFKVKFGEGSDKPIGFCPYCGHSGKSCWWTQEQAEYLSNVAGQQIVNPMLDGFARRVNRGNRPGDFIQIKAKVKHGPPPVKPCEPNDPMAITTFDCCDDKIKHDGSKGNLFCITCGKKKVA